MSDISTGSKKDFSLYSGERQTATTIDQIRFDHIVRYEMACERILKSRSDGDLVGLDIFCGNGYGSFLAANALKNAYIFGIDGCKEAVDSANLCYSRPNNFFSFKTFPFILPKNSYDFIFCFESLEHVENDEMLANQIRCSLKIGGWLFLSVPDESRNSLGKNPHKFHYRHYTRTGLNNLFGSHFEFLEWYGQDVYEFTDDGVNTFVLLSPERQRPRIDEPGQNLILVMKKLND